MASLLARRKQGGGMKIDTAGSRQAVAVTKRIVHLGQGGKKFTDLFRVEGDIHDGGEQCRIKVVKDRQSGAEYAVKVQAKRRIRGANEALFRRMTERMMNMPADANVVCVHACYEDDQYFYTMMDSCKGGDLFDFFRMLVSDDLTPDELNKELQIVMKEMMKSLNHLHKQGLVHKDVKLENLVFQEKGGMNIGKSSPKKDDGSPKSPKMLKLIDFDFTEEWEPGSPRSKAVVGTDGYIAPEAYHGDVNPKSDIYSAGVVLFLLVVGRFPYPDEIFDDQPGENYVGNAKMKEIYIKMEKYWNANGCPSKNRDPKMFASRAWTKLREAREFAIRCMEFDFQKRYDADQALADPWLKNVVTASGQ